MPNWLHTTALFFTVVLAYIWLETAALRPYALQIFALTVAVFFISKRLTRSKLWHIAPDHTSLEITLITLAVLLLIGATGNVNSLFFPLSFVHIFFLVLSCRPSTAIMTTIMVVLFHLGIAGNFSLTTLQSLLALPIVLLIFLFAKAQYDEAKTSEAIIADEAERLEVVESKQRFLKDFLTNFLQPRIKTLAGLLDNGATPKELGTQLSLIDSEVEKLLEEK